jgi:hypothetical protein
MKTTARMPVLARNEPFPTAIYHSGFRLYSLLSPAVLPCMRISASRQSENGLPLATKNNRGDPKAAPLIAAE